MLAGLAFATLINFPYNIAVARCLGPTAFGHTTAVYTLLLLISSVTLSFTIRNAITIYLNLPDSVLIAMLAVGTAFYVPLGARRGYIQGACEFRRLARNL